LIQFLYNIAVWVLPVLFAITLHEAAHGWVADKLGDPTARNLGRISLNPIRHIDPVGTVLMPLVLLVAIGVAFGAAKPVPVDPRNFRQPQLDMAMVALAGPVSNFIMAIFWALLITSSLHFLPRNFFSVTLQLMGQAGVAINLLLIALNILPIPPLDGSKILAGVLPASWVSGYMQLERYGITLIIVLIVIGVIFKLPLLWSILHFLVKPFMLFFETVFNFQGIYF